MEVLEASEERLSIGALSGKRFGKVSARNRWLMMVLVALVVRLLVMMFLYPEQLDPARDHWKFGYETGRIARSIAQGQGFSNPLFSNTGPTIWMTPVYPYIVAGVFKIFGIYTTISAFVLLSLNALTSALTCIPIFFIARKTFSDRVASWAGWGWVFFPYAVYFPMERIWETWLSTLLLSLLFLAGIHLEDRQTRYLEWIGFGALWGLAALTSPVVLAVLPFLGALICYRRFRFGLEWLRPAMASILVLAAVVSPWFIRNYQVFHRLVPFRDNMGIVLRLGTRGNTDHWAPYELGPWHNETEWAEFQRLGEFNYMAHKKQQAISFIKAHPVWYVWTSARRAFFLWTGFWSFDSSYLREEPLDLANIPVCTTFTVLASIGLWRAFRQKNLGAVPFLLVLLTFPVVYYITSPEAYYRRPIDPFIVILAAFAIASRAEWKTRKTRKVVAEPEYEEVLAS
jgi:4-amino-4-deoxy-L-arabinose transferase-like glycosyltransferase